MYTLAQVSLNFASPINPTGWVLLGLVPLGVVALYFLKLRRHSVQVPSTLLWRRSIEDLHVNSLFQRLRKNLLLFLQLLAVGLILFALAGPRFKGLSKEGRWVVIAIDESASMGATDVKPTRLDEAKEQARKIIAAMEQGDLAMIVAFSSSARVVSNYTSDRALLRSRIDAITPTDGSTSLQECLQLVSGLANPQKYFEPGEGQKAEDPKRAKLYVITDGGFADVEGFQLGAIDPEVVAIGPAPQIPPPPREQAGDEQIARITPTSTPSDNLAILALQAVREENDSDRLQIFGRVRNHRASESAVQVNLYRIDSNGGNAEETLVDAVALDVPARGDQSFQFDLVADPLLNQYEARFDVSDALASDNRAFVVVGSTRRARVLLVTSGNRFIADTLQTEVARSLAELTVISPDALSEPGISSNLAAGAFDYVIFDGVRPERSPEANTLYFGALPPGLEPDQARELKNPVVLDWDSGYPLLQYVRDLGTILINEAVTVDPPTGARVLVECEQGPLALAIPRSGFLDVVFTFPLVRGREFNTNWTLKPSFPLVILNSLRVLGRARSAGDDASTTPGVPVILRPDTAADKIEIIGPDGKTQESLARNVQGSFVATATSRAGIYHARWGDGPGDSSAFAVNLFDARESDLSTRGQVPPGVEGEAADAFKIKIGHSPVSATRFDAPAIEEWWWPLTLIALAIVLIEWIIYNKRIFV